jgi:P2-related tail formation protein
MQSINELFLMYLAWGFSVDDAMLWAKNAFEDANQKSPSDSTSDLQITDDILNIKEL